jgi:serine/threonine protein kinase
MMTPERWQQVKELLGRALELEPAGRAAFLDHTCASDPSLRTEVERLLAVQQKAGTGFLSDSATHEAPGRDLRVEGDRRIGQVIGSYKIVETIGEGGMGAVYCAVRADDQYEKQVAMKLVHAGQDSAFIISRFKNERQILASLDHPNIARLLDGGTTEDGAPYFVMELIKGQPIDEYCDQKRLPTTERLKIFLQVCAAVQYAHQRLIIHRDIKPGNILVDTDGMPKLLDFGIAKLLDTSGGDDQATLTEFRALTPGYASPEQIKGGAMTTATDVYSLGVILYELLTGHRPYRLPNRNPHEVARAICETEPERPSTVVTKTVAPDAGHGLAEITPASVSAVRDGSLEKLRRHLRGDLDNIVLMALRKEPELRYTSVEHFAEDVRRHLQNLPVSASRGTLSYRAAKFVSRHRAGVLATATVALTLFAGVFMTLREAHIARKEAAIAQEQAAIAQAERAKAQRRFDDVRKLANSLIFELHDSIANLPGSTPARKLIMDRAVEYLDSLAKDSSGDSTLQRDLGFAYHRIGQVQGDPNQGNLGQTDAMLTSMKKAAALFDEVAKANPGATADQLNAAFGHRLLASVSSGGDERRRQLDQAMAITERLIETDGSNPKVKSERSLEFAVLAAQQDGDGDAAAAIESFRQCGALKEDLLKLSPDYPHARQGLAMVKVQLADELVQLGSRKEALEFNLAGINLYQAVVAQDRNNARGTRELAVSTWKRGEIQMMDGEFGGALANYRRALAVEERMEKLDPQNAMLRSDVAGSTVSVGKALVELGHLDQGLPMIDQGNRLLEQELNQDPNSDPAAGVMSYVWKGEAFSKSGRLGDAIASYRKAVSMLETLRGNPPDSTAQCQLAAAYTRLGAALARRGSNQEADAAYRKAVQIVEPLRTSKAPSLRTSYALADAYFGLGELAESAAQRSGLTPALQREHWSEARDWYGKSQAAWRDIPNPGVVNLEGFPCGSPRAVAQAKARCDAALARLLSARPRLLPTRSGALPLCALRSPV